MLIILLFKLFKYSNTSGLMLKSIVALAWNLKVAHAQKKVLQLF